MAKKRKPLAEVGKGANKVRIYEQDTGNGYKTYLVYYVHHGETIRLKRSVWEEAMAEAQSAAGKIEQGETVALRFTNAEAALYEELSGRVKQRGLTLNQVVERYLEAADLVPPGQTLLEVVRAHTKRENSIAEKKTVPEVYEEFLTRLEANQVSTRDLNDVRARLRKFKEAFDMPIMDLTGKAIEDWLVRLKTKDGEPISLRTRWNFAGQISRLMAFAKSRKYLPKDWDELEDIDRGSNKVAKIEVFTPAEMQTYLEAATTDDELFVLLFGGFAGLRSAEVERLRGEDIRHLDEEPHIVIPDEVDHHHQAGKKETNKTGRRIVPILPNLLEWLQDRVFEPGRILKDPCIPRHLASLAEKAGLTWKANGLRHSFISYRVAQIKNSAQVAEEAGNSVAMIKRHYLKRVLEREARAWFGIMPAGVDQEKVAAMA